MLEYYHVDVFAETRYAGNQLAVVLGAAALGDEQMQIIAREFDFSESTFVHTSVPATDGYRVRIFTPGDELPFAGHPTLGTASVLRNLDPAVPSRIDLDLNVGRVPVTFVGEGENTVAWMAPPAPELGDTHAAAEIAHMLGLNAADLDSHYPVQEATVGPSFFIVPLRGLDALKRARVDRARRDGLFGERGASVNCLLFSPQGYSPTQQLSARMFFETNGIMREDPATGSANTCLGAYLSSHRYFGDVDLDIAVGQGYEMGRPSLLHVRARGPSHIEVGGKVQIVARGQLL